MVLFRDSRLKRIRKVLMIAFLSCLLAVIASVPDRIDVYVTIDGVTTAYQTNQDTVGRFLMEAGIVIAPRDRMDRAFDDHLICYKENRIVIETPKQITVKADGRTYTVLTHSSSVENVLSQADVLLRDEDRIVITDESGQLVANPGSVHSLATGMYIKIMRSLQYVTVQTKTLPYRTTFVENDQLLKSESGILYEGQIGIKQYSYETGTMNGEIVSFELIQDELLQPMEPAVEQIGTLYEHTTKSGETFVYKKVYEMLASAYTTAYEECGKKEDHPLYGITFSGLPVRPGIIAVDPDVIDLLTNVYVETVGQGADYGFSLAADTGSAIKGHRIDLYMEDRADAFRWGVRPVRVYILYEQDE